MSAAPQQHPAPSSRSVVDQQQPYDHTAWEWAIRDAARDGRITSPELRLMALWHHARADVQTGLTKPFVAELVDVLDVGSTKVDDLRKELVDLGFLTLEKRGIGRGNPSVYRLSLPAEARVFYAGVSLGSSTGVDGNSAGVSRGHLEHKSSPTDGSTAEKTPARKHSRTAAIARRLLVKVLRPGAST